MIVNDNDEGIAVPQCNFFLQEDHYDELQGSINPLAESESYGINLYKEVLTFLYDKIRSNPDIYGELV